jgi:SET domain-containing protein
MLLVKTYVDRSAIDGCGVFTAEDIPAGTLVWKFNSAIDIEITAPELESLPPPAREVAMRHSFINEDGRMILARDNGVFFNHSDDPNTDICADGNVAARDIRAGEELTEDYRRLPPGACRSFLDAP